MSPKKKALAARSKTTAKKAAKKPKKVEEEEEEDEEEEEEEEEEPKAKKGKVAPKKAGKKGKVDWQSMLDSLESGGLTGNIFFPKSGKTRVRLILEDEDDQESWFTEVQGEFEGKVRSRYIIRGVVLHPAPDDKKIMGIVVSKTAMKGIVGMLAEGYDLFDPEEGHGITISKTGASLNTSWGVTPSPKPVEIDLDEYEDSESDLESLEKQLEQIGANRNKPKKKKGSDDDEDEDDEEEDW